MLARQYIEVTVKTSVRQLAGAPAGELRQADRVKGVLNRPAGNLALYGRDLEGSR
jgi:hypothetical protein